MRRFMSNRVSEPRALVSMQAIEARICLAAVAFNDAVAFPAGVQPQGVVVGDFDQDDDFDVAVTNYSNGVIGILVNDGGVLEQGDAYDVNLNLSGLTTGDLNRDGILDLIGTGDNVGYLLGNGDGTFDTVVNLAAGTTP